MSTLIFGGTKEMGAMIRERMLSGEIDVHGQATARRPKPAATATMEQPDRASEIRLKVAVARQHHPHIAADTADRWIAEGIAPDEASLRLYDLISEPIEAAKIGALYRASKGKR